ncbi:FHA domain-containing protein [Arthrobacter sp. ZGTC131]|uniref:FHA domain-containing protein n=1 Tax=Arthrobacter sp. ZGTC131 TaxID=2058898 RepID=UPI0015E45761|nr:FHA domain-containing protein [Arthrobacter sp. ZGTC131]
MTAASYIPGGWLGLVRSGTAVILGPDTPPPLVNTVWSLLGDGPEVHDVLHAVTTGFGVPLSRAPWFGIVGFGESLRVFLRGDLDLIVQLPGGPVELDGRNVTTWTERWLDSPEWFSLAVPGPSSALELPVTEGAVLLQTLRVDVTGGGSLAARRHETDLAKEAAAEVIAEPVLEASAEIMAEPVLEASSETVVEPVLEASAEIMAEPVLEASSETVVEPVLEASAETVGGPAEDGPNEERPDEGGLEETRLPETGLTVTGAADLAGRQEDGQQVPAAATELTGSYDHLWDKTVMRSIEDAAVRDGEDHDGDLPAASLESGTSLAMAGPATEAEQTNQEPDGQAAPGPDADKHGKPARDAAAAEPAEPAAAPANRAPVSGGLIDSVPWATGGNRAPRPEAPPSFVSLPDARPAAELPEQELPAQLQPVQIEPERPGSPSSSPSPSPSFVPDGDHDGQTILKSDLAPASAQPASAPASGPVPGAGPLGAGPLVLARVCARGHANPPTSAQCPSCGSPLPDVAVQVPRPRLGRLRLSTGELIDLDESLVIGRQPSVSRVQGGVMPRLIQVASPGGDISRSHVEVRLEGWHVMLCDLKATNGTVLVREGQQPRRLAQNEMAIVLDGDIAELGDDISLRFEEIL